AGDLLYIPRGHGHEAFTTNCSSLHITVGLTVFRWADLLSSALACVSRHDVRFRHALPVGWLGSSEEPASLREQFQEMLRLLAESARVEEAVEHFGSQFLAALAPLPDSHFVPPEILERVDLDTVLEKPPGTICRIIQEGDTVSVQFPGNKVS